MLFNRFYAGSAMPISGTIKRWWGLLPNTVYGTPTKTLDGVIQGFFSPSSKNGPWSLLLQPIDSLAGSISQLFPSHAQADLKSILFILLLLVLAGMVIWLVRRQADWAGKVADRFGLLPFFAGCFVSIISYKATGYLHAKYWYWIAETVFLVFAGGILVECIFREIRQRMNNNKLPSRLSQLACFFIFLTFSVNIWQLCRWDVGMNAPHPYLVETEQIEKNTRPGSVIGMTGGGVTAYFIHDRTVVNLDGLIMELTISSN